MPREEDRRLTRVSSSTRRMMRKTRLRSGKAGGRRSEDEEESRLLRLTFSARHGAMVSAPLGERERMPLQLKTKSEERQKSSIWSLQTPHPTFPLQVPRPSCATFSQTVLLSRIVDLQLKERRENDSTGHVLGRSFDPTGLGLISLVDIHWRVCICCFGMPSGSRIQVFGGGPPPKSSKRVPMGCKDYFGFLFEFPFILIRPCEDILGLRSSTTLSFQAQKDDRPRHRRTSNPIPLFIPPTSPSFTLLERPDRLPCSASPLTKADPEAS